ncbi:MAG TPA: HEAT repeat domain-containing protein, partial [Gemmatimonadaceae bacterium]|nr:HEAT repeat domain-containing protein [Gemmatimonadaceae bacterium]
MMMRSSLLIVSVFITAGTPPATSTAAMAMHHHTPDVRELLVSARGVAPAVCLLAADGVGSTGRWGGGFWDAPAMSIGAEVRMRVREMLRARLDDDDRRALLDALGADDPCVRHLAATIIGRSDDKSFVAALTSLLNATLPGERQSVAIALGLLGARDGVDPLLRLLRDPSPDV